MYGRLATLHHPLSPERSKWASTGEHCRLPAHQTPRDSGAHCTHLRLRAVRRIHLSSHLPTGHMLARATALLNGDLGQHLVRGVGSYLSAHVTWPVATYCSQPADHSRRARRVVSLMLGLRGRRHTRYLRYILSTTFRSCNCGCSLSCRSIMLQSLLHVNRVH